MYTTLSQEAALALVLAGALTAVVARPADRGRRGQSVVGIALTAMAAFMALGLGVVGGFAVGQVRLTLPNLQRLLAPIASDPVSAALSAGALSVLIIPFGMYIVYQLFFLNDR